MIISTATYVSATLILDILCSEVFERGREDGWDPVPGRVGGPQHLHCLRVQEDERASVTNIFQILPKSQSYIVHVL